MVEIWKFFYHPEKSGTCNFFIEIVNYPDSTYGRDGNFSITQKCLGLVIFLEIVNYPPSTYGRDGIDTTSRVSTGMPRETVNG